MLASAGFWAINIIKLLVIPIQLLAVSGQFKYNAQVMSDLYNTMVQSPPEQSALAKHSRLYWGVQKHSWFLHPSCHLSQEGFPSANNPNLLLKCCVITTTVRKVLIEIPQRRLAFTELVPRKVLPSCDNVITTCVPLAHIYTQYYLISSTVMPEAKETKERRVCKLTRHRSEPFAWGLKIYIEKQ